MEWIEGLVEKANKLIDDYIWDTSQDEAWLEGYVRDWTGVEDVKDKGYIGEAWDDVNDWYDATIWDASEDEAELEKKVKDLLEDEEHKAEDEDREITKLITERVTSTVESIGDIFVSAIVDLSGVTSGIVAGITSGLSSLAVDFGDALAGIITDFAELVSEKFFKLLSEVIS